MNPQSGNLTDTIRCVVSFKIGNVLLDITSPDEVTAVAHRHWYIQRRQRFKIPMAIHNRQGCKLWQRRDRSRPASYLFPGVTVCQHPIQNVDQKLA